MKLVLRSVLVLVRVPPTICFTWPEWRSMQGRNRVILGEVIEGGVGLYHLDFGMGRGVLNLVLVFMVRALTDVLPAKLRAAGWTSLL